MSGSHAVSVLNIPGEDGSSRRLRFSIKIIGFHLNSYCDIKLLVSYCFSYSQATSISFLFAKIESSTVNS